MKMNIITFKAIRYKPSASGNIIPSIFNYKLMRPVSNLRLPKEQKKLEKNEPEKGRRY